MTAAKAHGNILFTILQIKNMKSTLIAILLLSFISCSKVAKRQPRKNEITKVSLGVITGMSGGFLQIEIDSSLQYKLFRKEIYGDKSSEIPKLNYKLFWRELYENDKFYTGRISRELWDSINIRFKNLKYNELDTLGCVAVDGPEAGLIVFKNGSRFIGYNCFKSFPKGFNEAIDWLIATQERVSLKRTEDSLLFEFPILPPPPAPYKAE